MRKLRRKIIAAIIGKIWKVTSKRVMKKIGKKLLKTVLIPAVCGVIAAICWKLFTSYLNGKVNKDEMY